MTGVLFVAESKGSALCYYRAQLPAQGLARLGYRTWVRDVLVERTDHRLCGFDLWQRQESMTPVPKHVVVRHLRDPEAHEVDSVEMFADARAHGQHVWMDLDDDYWHLPEHNPGLEHFSPAELATLDRNLAAVDGVFCSTRHLMGVVAEHTDTPLWFAPPAIDLACYPARKPGTEHTPLRVGWLGLTKWRGPDLALFGPHLAEVLRGREVEFWHIGDHPDNPPVEDFLPADFPVPIVKRPWVAVADLPKTLAQIDVAVIPMDLDDPVNLSRSETTGLALGAAGVLFIASGAPAYGPSAPDMGSLAVALAVGLDAGPEWRDALRTAYRKTIPAVTPIERARCWDAAFRSVGTKAERRKAGTVRA